jgi:hypothetical protein
MNFHLALNPWLVAVQFFLPQDSRTGAAPSRGPFAIIKGLGSNIRLPNPDEDARWAAKQQCPWRKCSGKHTHMSTNQYTRLFTHVILLWWPLRSCAGSHDGGRCGCPGSIADPATSSVMAATFACPGRPNSDTHKTVTLCAVLLPILRLVWLTARRHVS